MQNFQKPIKISLGSANLIDFASFLGLIRFFFILISLTQILSCQSDSTTKTNTNPITNVSALSSGSASLPKSNDEISIMSFNVENLFDATHDKDREDFTYLPAAEKATRDDVKKFCSELKIKSYRAECETLDWNEKVIQEKLKNVGRVIRFVDQGKGPDVLLLIEVENEKILNRLVNDQLKDLGYQTVVLLEGPDLRGIDPGFISRFPIQGKPVLHLIPYTDPDPEQVKWAQRSRGILEVTVKAPNGKSITFLVGHFPSQNNPTAWRAQSVQFAKKLMSDYQKQGRTVILGGDLNITEKEDNSHGFFKKELSEVGDVSHLVGCKDCLGTHNYRGEWSHLDALIFSKSLKDLGFQLIPESISVIKEPNHTKKNGTPHRFNAEKLEGVSDHFPLYARIKMTDWPKVK